MRLQRKMNRAVASLGRFSALALLFLWGTAALAITISPVLVELSQARRVASITLTNPGDRPISFQTEVKAWTQPDGVDIYADTDELIVVPPIAEIAPGGSQIFRVTNRTAPSPHERAYRLIFEDVTELLAVTTTGNEVSINIRVNHNLPVFFAAPGKPPAQVRLGPCATDASAAPAGLGCVRLDNDGRRYVQIKTVTFEGAGYSKQIGTSARVLAGAWRQWTFDLPSQWTGSLRVKAETSDGPVTFEWPRPTPAR